MVPHMQLSANCGLFFSSIHNPFLWCTLYDGGLTHFLVCWLIAVDAFLCGGLVVNDIIRLLLLVVELCSRNVGIHKSENDIIGPKFWAMYSFTQRSDWYSSSPVDGVRGDFWINVVSLCCHIYKRLSLAYRELKLGEESFYKATVFHLS